MRRFLGSLQFLTILPIHARTASPGETAIFFPLTGALLGLAAGALMLALNSLVGRALSSLIAIGALVGLTGCLHEDGLADVVDAVRAGRPRERVIAILKDSRIGTYGAFALIFAVGLRWQSLAQIAINPIAGLAAALALSRTSMVALASGSQSLTPGLGQEFIASCSPGVLIGAVAQCAILVALLTPFIGRLHAVAMTFASILAVLLARAYFRKRLAGINGDCLGATCQMVETLNLVILAWHPSF
jgi:adenosylcobinamide-GDP ribazoletransferase